MCEERDGRDGREGGGRKRPRTDPLPVAIVGAAFLPYIPFFGGTRLRFPYPSFSSTSDITPPPSTPTYLPPQLRRCYKLCLECRPQLALSPEPKSAKEEKEEKGKPERQQAEEGGDRGPPAVNSCLVDLAIKRNTPRGMVASYVSAFYEVYLEGHVNRQLVMIMLYVLGW